MRFLRENATVCFGFPGAPYFSAKTALQFDRDGQDKQLGEKGQIY